ncbi:TcpQ domain-containing protein [Pseudoalteromonas sp. SSDWG2]|uniref:TcpQ domain-containing protein n=1 Tax=Pseudoalteromonas sp. SSDWG2 TaxID=3139391 RepID=UPI003BAC3ED7
MWFWIKHLSLAFILILAAAYFLLGEGPMYKSTGDNAAAAGLSQFYANIKNSVRNATDREKYVIELGEPTGDLEVMLEQRLGAVQEVDLRWKGAVKARRFRAGATLKKVMSDYAKEEGIAFYWYLGKDYVVKHPFRVDDSFVSTLYQVGKAIDSDFEFEVQTFFCYRERAAIITERPAPYIRENCLKVSSS